MVNLAVTPPDPCLLQMSVVKHRISEIIRLSVGLPRSSASSSFCPMQFAIQIIQIETKSSRFCEIQGIKQLHYIISVYKVDLTVSHFHNVEKTTAVIINGSFSFTVHFFLLCINRGNLVSISFHDF